jgi:hypothetical protein
LVPQDYQTARREWRIHGIFRVIHRKPIPLQKSMSPFRFRAIKAPCPIGFQHGVDAFHSNIGNSHNDL